jgi:hypothetical protein
MQRSIGFTMYKNFLIWRKKSNYNKYHKMYCRNVIDVNWGLVVKLALPGKVTRRAYKV